MKTFEDTQYNPNLCEVKATGSSVKTNTNKKTAECWYFLLTDKNYNTFLLTLKNLGSATAENIPNTGRLDIFWSKLMHIIIIIISFFFY